MQIISLSCTYININILLQSVEGSLIVAAGISSHPTGIAETSTVDMAALGLS